MDSLCKSIEGLPLIVKIILAIPLLDIVWNIYRVCKSASKGNVVGIVLGVLLILFLSWNIVAIFDIIYLIIKKDRVWWID